VYEKRFLLFLLYLRNYKIIDVISLGEIYRVRCEIAVKFSEDLLIDAAIVGTIAIVLSVCNDRFTVQYATVAETDNPIFCTHSTVG